VSGFEHSDTVQHTYMGLPSPPPSYVPDEGNHHRDHHEEPLFSGGTEETDAAEEKKKMKEEIAKSAVDLWVIGAIKATHALSVETGSVYGSGLAIPQIARSVGWSSTLKGLVFRSYFFLMVNYVLETCFVYYLLVEQVYWDRFAGQPHLCDFGVGSGVTIGPGGTAITQERTYQWQAWSTRHFVKESLIQLFPHMHQEIDDKVDPGEYGLESVYCRAMCCFIFIASTLHEVKWIKDTAKLLYSVPSRAESWVTVVDQVDGQGEAPGIDGICFKVAGMPMFWKVLNLALLVVPRVLLWLMVSHTGVMFLMESADINDMIVNAVALTFIINFDTLIITAFGSEVSQQLMERLEDYQKPIRLHEGISQTNLIAHADSIKDEGHHLWSYFPRFFIFAIIATYIFIQAYYLQFCEGHFLEGYWKGFRSQPVLRPAYNRFFTVLSELTGIPPEPKNLTVYWSMPGE